MKCYIKAASTFLTLAQRDTEDYSLTLDSMSGEKSSVTILGEDSPAFLTGNFLLLNSDVYRIDTVTPSKGKTKLGLLPPDTMFDRVLLYEESNAATVGAYIASVITSEWVNQADAVFAAPYVSVTNSDITEFAAPETEENGTFNFLEYIRKMRADNGVTIHFSFSGNTLVLSVERDASNVHPLVQNDGHTQLISSDFQASALSKVSVFKSVDTGEKDEDNNPIYETQTSVWYLAKDGSVSDTVPQDRADGGWGSISIGDDDDAQEKAAEEFAKNEESRKIELFSDVGMSVGDRARIRINGEIVESTVTGIYRKRGEIRTRYKLGDMITTLTEKVDALSGTKTVVVRSSAGGTQYPAWSGGDY